MPPSFPGTLLEFEQLFRTEEACLAYLERVRWPGGVRCLRCSSNQSWRASRDRFRCGSCRKDFSTTAGTLLQGSKVPMRLWFRAMWLLTNQKSGISALGLQRTLGLGSYETAWAMLHKLRRATVRPDRELLSGRIEVDETIVGGRRKFKNGKRPCRYLEKALIVIAAEVRGANIGRIRMRQIPAPSRDHLIKFVKDTVRPGSEVVSDGWRGYHALGKEGFSLDQTITNHGAKEAHAQIVPKVHRVASLLKRWLLGTHQGRVSCEKLDYYLDEFVFRFNRRASPTRGHLFRRLLEQVVAIPSTR